jgi:hypothetical protein
VAHALASGFDRAFIAGAVLAVVAAVVALAVLPGQIAEAAGEGAPVPVGA